MTIEENFKEIRAAIGAACKEAARDPQDVQLVAVSKFQPRDRIEAALVTGQRVFGENRVQDANERWSGLKESYSGLRLHLIGGLQTNKVREAIRLFDVIETVDRENLVAELVKELKKTPKAMEFFIQVNTGDEAQKGGVAVDALPALLKTCHEAGLPVSGLMCIPPVDQPPGLHFALLKKLALRHNLPKLSMGMSGDYKKAIAAGATHVRIGTALFGERPAANSD